jgi:hypothetical protein
MVIWRSLVESTNKLFLSVAGVITAVFGIYLYGSRQGALREAQKAAEKDRQNARKIENAADQARATDIGDPAEFLRKRGKLRADK